MEGNHSVVPVVEVAETDLGAEVMGDAGVGGEWAEAPQVVRLPAQEVEDIQKARVVGGVVSLVVEEEDHLEEMAHRVEGGGALALTAEVVAEVDIQALSSLLPAVLQTSIPG